jgi:hypothetical protein
LSSVFSSMAVTSFSVRPTSDYTTVSPSQDVIAAIFREISSVPVPTAIAWQHNDRGAAQTECGSVFSQCEIRMRFWRVVSLVRHAVRFMPHVVSESHDKRSGSVTQLFALLLPVLRTTDTANRRSTHHRHRPKRCPLASRAWQKSNSDRAWRQSRPLFFCSGESARGSLCGRSHAGDRADAPQPIGTGGPLHRTFWMERQPRTRRHSAHHRLCPRSVELLGACSTT